MLKVKEISCFFGRKNVLDSIEFELNKGQIISILGANGSGKSTLLRCIVGLLKYSGEVLLKGQNIKNYNVKQRASFLAYVPQSNFMPYDFSVLEVVLMGRFHGSSFGLTYSKKDMEISLNALKKVEIEHFKDRIFNRLSGGEKQLVLLARTLAQQSQIIILDEPVTGLDIGNQMRLLELLSSLKNLNKAIIQATHNPEHALRISDKVIWLDNGKILAKGDPKSVITTSRIEQIYSINSQFLTHKDKEFFLPLNFIKDKR